MRNRLLASQDDPVLSLPEPQPMSFWSGSPSRRLSSAFGSSQGGGGAGGYRLSFGTDPSGGGGSTETALSLSPGTVYTVTIGAGGAGNPSSPAGGGTAGSGGSYTAGGDGGALLLGRASAVSERRCACITATCRESALELEHLSFTRGVLPSHRKPSQRPQPRA